MATIRQLSSGNWNAQVRVKGKPAQSKTFPTEVAAQQWAKQQEALTKEHKTHTIYSLGMSYCQARLLGRGSHKHALQIVEHLAKAFPQPIQDITPQQINAYKLERLKTVKPATCRTQLAFMSRLYRWAKRELLIDIANPLADIALPQASKSSDKVVSKGELFLVLEHLSPAMKLITELAYETAMRRSEIVKLTIEHVHLEERIADVVDGKNGTRSVPLTKRAVELLQEAIRLAKSKRIPTGRLFNITPHSVSTAVRRARQIDTDRYALGHLIQFIFRGSIRKHEDMHLLITSLRMKSLLENWLEN